MERLIELGQLLDWYGDFLTERQRTILRQYAYEDCSLSEIAEREGITRQAVRDAIAKAEHELNEMEKRLSVIARVRRQRTAVEGLRRMTDDPAMLRALDALEGIWEDDDGV